MSETTQKFGFDFQIAKSSIKRAHTYTHIFVKALKMCSKVLDWWYLHLYFGSYNAGNSSSLILYDKQ